MQQLNLCASARTIPTDETIRATALHLPNTEDFEIVEIIERAAVLRGLDEQPRYYLQHALGFQIHDQRHPHKPQLHRRADIGWKDRTNE
ncbi:hypothetical protein [Saccharopolyspora sp. 5N708]|uniref:hypothetical protein n=1 Tax=Saccharopolyspora sp. 5N708 TaxID=3457424 RepID=UPI003FD402F4